MLLHLSILVDLIHYVIRNLHYYMYRREFGTNMDGAMSIHITEKLK